MERVSILDHGYIELVESWGSDEAIICAARMSTNKGFFGWGPKHEPNCLWHQRAHDIDGREHDDHVCSCREEPKPGDEKLLRYLWEMEHSTPFEMCGLTVEVKAPIMVFREWHRHRVPFGYSEMSARYVPLPDENYSPTVDRIVSGSRATKNKQASSLAGECHPEAAQQWLIELEKVYAQAQALYELGLKLGVPKELARLPVPVACYSRMRATSNLRGWLAFMRLRMAPNAQYEIRVYAERVSAIVAEKFPRTHALFMEGFAK